jgi:hypothetical protein
MQSGFGGFRCWYLAAAQRLRESGVCIALLLTICSARSSIGGILGLSTLIAAVIQRRQSCSFFTSACIYERGRLRRLAQRPFFLSLFFHNRRIPFLTNCSQGYPSSQQIQAKISKCSRHLRRHHRRDVVAVRVDLSESDKPARNQTS